MQLKLTRLLMMRSLRERPLRIFLSIFGIILGVASLLAISLTNRAALNSVTKLIYDTTGRSQLVITSAVSGEQGLPEKSLDRAQRVANISLLAPVLEVSTVLAEDEASGQLALDFLGGIGGLGGLVLWGVDPAVDAQVRDYKVVDGRFLDELEDAEEIVLVKTYAAEQELSVGDWVEIVTPYGPVPLKLVGLIGEEGAGRQNKGAFGVLPLKTAQKIFDQPQTLSHIDIISTYPDGSGDALERLKGELQSVLGPEITIINPASQGERAKQMLGSYQIGLNFLSAMALFVGAFLIYNAFSMTVVERTREIGMLRTVGMTRGQVSRLVLAEAAILGVVGAALGVGLGIVLARGIATIYELLLEQELSFIQLPASLLLQSALVGLTVTMVAAAIPAWQAGQISPLEALRIRGNVREGWVIRRGWWLGLVLLLLSTIILLWNPFPYDTQFRLGSVVVVALFFGGVLTIPATVSIWGDGMGELVRRLYGNSGLLGSLNIQRARLRTTLTVAALMVGISMLIVVWIMTGSFKLDLEDWLEGYLGGDIYVTSSVNLHQGLITRLQSIEGVAAVAPVRYFDATWLTPDGEELDILFMATEPAAYSKVTSFQFDEIEDGATAELAMERLMEGNTIFISSVIAEKYGLQPGDDFTLMTRRGPQQFEIAAVVVDFYNQGMVVEGSWQDMERHFRLDDANAYMIKVDGSDIALVQERIEEQLGDRYNLSLESSQSIQESIDTLIDQAYSVFDVLALISMFVAFMAIMNTLTMNVMERTQEIGMLRSIGMVRRQVVLMVLAEAGVVGLMGGAIGLLFGVILGRIFLLSMTAMSGYSIQFVLPLSQALLGVLLAVVVAHLAALFPARRASRTRILDAIHQD
jgi:putative ABC transport system permease protein